MRSRDWKKEILKFNLQPQEFYIGEQKNILSCTNCSKEYSVWTPMKTLVKHLATHRKGE